MRRAKQVLPLFLRCPPVGEFPERHRVDCETVSGVKAWRVHEFGEPSQSTRSDSDEVPAPEPDSGELPGARGGHDAQLQRRRQHARALPDRGAATSSTFPAWRSWASWRAPEPVPKVGSASGGGHPRWGLRRLAEWAVGPAAMASKCHRCPSWPTHRRRPSIFRSTCRGSPYREGPGFEPGGTEFLRPRPARGCGSARRPYRSPAWPAQHDRDGQDPRRSWNCAAPSGASVAVDYREREYVAAVLEGDRWRGVDVSVADYNRQRRRRPRRSPASRSTDAHLLVRFASGSEAEDEGIIAAAGALRDFSLCGMCPRLRQRPFRSSRKRPATISPPTPNGGTRRRTGARTRLEQERAAGHRNEVASPTCPRLCRPWRTARPSGAMSP